jgi:hypothetical protein
MPWWLGLAVEGSTLPQSPDGVVVSGGGGGGGGGVVVSGGGCGGVVSVGVESVGGGPSEVSSDEPPPQPCNGSARIARAPPSRSAPWARERTCLISDAPSVPAARCRVVIFRANPHNMVRVPGHDASFVTISPVVKSWAKQVCESRKLRRGAKIVRRGAGGLATVSWTWCWPTGCIPRLG